MARQGNSGSFGQNGRKGGRTPGTPNKVTTQLKETILKALDEANPKGAIEYLKEQAAKNPNAFLSLVGRVLPLQVQGDPDQPLVPQSIVFVVQQQKDSENQT